MRAALLLGLVPLCSGALLELKGSAEDPAVIEMDGLALTKTSVGLEVGGSLVTSSYNVDEELGRLREENAALAAQVGLLNETLRALSLHVFSLPPAPPTSPPPITPPPPSPPVYPPSSPDMAVAACINEGGFVTDVKDWASIDARYNSGYKYCCGVPGSNMAALTSEGWAWHGSMTAGGTGTDWQGNVDVTITTTTCTNAHAKGGYCPGGKSTCYPEA